MVNILHFATKTSQNSPTNRQQINRVLWQVLIINLLVAGAKIAVGALGGSISMIADGFHSAADASSNVIGLVGSTMASRPPDDDHPYGHHKYETFATLGIGLLLLLTSWNVLKSVIARLVEGSQPEVTTLSFAVMISTLLLNLGVTMYEKRKGRQLNSPILLADADHTKSDIFVSLSVLVSLVAVKAGWPWLDAATALIIVGVIAHTGLQIIRRASDTLADSAVIDTSEVEQVVMAVDGVESCHKIRSRGNCEATHLDLHIQVDPQMTITDAHNIGHVAQQRLKNKLGLLDIIVHVEPKA